MFFVVGGWESEVKVEVYIIIYNLLSSFFSLFCFLPFSSFVGREGGREVGKGYSHQGKPALRWLGLTAYISISEHLP